MFSKSCAFNVPTLSEAGEATIEVEGERDSQVCFSGIQDGNIFKENRISGVMSLEDKFYPKPSGPFDVLTRIDNSLVKIAGKIPEFYQNLTGNDGKGLSRKSYLAGSLAFAVGASVASTASMYAALPFVAASAWMYTFQPNLESPLEEEIKLEALGLPKKFGKIERLATGIGTMFCGLFTWGSFKHLEMYAQQWSEVQEIYGNKANDVFQLHIAGAGVFASVTIAFGLYTLGEYMSKSNIPKPPHKSYVDKVVETAYGSIIPQPEATPIKLS